MMRHKKKFNLENIAAVDLFCGAGGLTRGLLNAGIPVVAGYDIDQACQFAYEHNNKPAKFFEGDISKTDGSTIEAQYPNKSLRVLVGCAPCQPFSRYTQGKETVDEAKWGLLSHFGRIVQEIKPTIVSMENVVDLSKHSIFEDFLNTLIEMGFTVTSQEVYCPDYGIPQQRLRLVVFASLLGPISIGKPTHKRENYVSVRAAIGNLKELKAGETQKDDVLHRACSLSDTNLKRIRHSKPGGTWRDWPTELVSQCHTKEKGKTYPSVYGRMEWDEPSPTITTQFFGFGNGRFGHPDQDRALSIREGAILQSFPISYQFVKEKSSYSTKTLGRMIGNAVPVRLGEVVGQAINNHLKSYA